MITRIMYLIIGFLIAGSYFNNENKVDRMRMYMIASDMGMDAFYQGCSTGIGINPKREETCQAAFKLYEMYLDNTLESSFND